MRIAFVLGNGFDIGLGLDTKYTDFYRYFLTQNNSTIGADGSFSNSHKEISDMMSSEDLPFWSDLEELFGKEINRFKELEKLELEKEYLENSLNNYLKREQERICIDYSNQGRERLRGQLDKTICGFIELFDLKDKDKCYTISFLSLNYTNVIDEIIRAVENNNKKYYYCKPLHIHGAIDNKVILGVDNEKQYDCNALLCNDPQKLKRVMEKPVLNNEVRRKEVHEVLNTLNKSDVIVIYGASIGSTDVFWWNKITEWLNESKERKLFIVGHISDYESASGTARLNLFDYKERFEQFSSSNNSDRIVVVERENWMFRFEDNTIGIKKRRLFRNLITPNP